MLLENPRAGVWPRTLGAHRTSPRALRFPSRWTGGGSGLLAGGAE